jgi:hypothetical protein
MKYTALGIIELRKEIWNKYYDPIRDKAFAEKAAEILLDSPEIMQEIQLHPEYLVEMFFCIVDKDKVTVPFFLNEVQKSFIDDLNKAVDDYKSGKRLNLKFLILKGRQQGFTSFITAYQLACTITRKNFEGFTAADENNNADTIFENKAKYPYSQLPKAIQPTEKYNNRKQLRFDKINSSWEVKTASKNMGRSRTINFFHGSEAAFWHDGISGTQAGLGEALTKDAIQILESTANGYNEFKDAWDSGKWENKFYEWWRTPEYRLNFESNEKESVFKEKVKVAELNQKIASNASEKDWIWQRCKWLYEVIQLEWEQIYWYYNKWDGYLNKELIKQEYPCSPDEAFLASGNCVFNKEILLQRKEYLKRLYEEHPPKRGRFTFEWNDPDTQDKIKLETIKWIDDLNGPITIYEDKKNGYPYVLGGDTKGEGRDKYAATIKNNVSGKRTAVLHMQATNSKPYTWQVYCLGYYFNWALVGIEINFNTAPVEELQRLNYPNQYMREATDTIEKEIKGKYGWKTDGNTRPRMIDKEIDLIENNIDLFTDITMIDEAMTFVYDKDGRPDAESGKHDDVLISDMITNQIEGQQKFTPTIEVAPIYPINSLEDKVNKNLEKLLNQRKEYGY